MSSKKKLFISGVTGTLGKEFAKTYHRKYQIVGYSRDEYKQYEMKKLYPDITYMIGDVRDSERLCFAMRGCTFVVHAAALKHIVIGEHEPGEFIKTNILGTMNVVNAARENGIKHLVFTSTDKAVEPINLYGATKLAGEMLVLDAGYSVVRYGNVFGSRGSVVPYFMRLKEKGYLTVNDLEMTRFSITMGEAVALVEHALHTKPGRHIPKLKAYVLKDLCEAICPTCEIRVSGIVKGEKMHEKLDHNMCSHDAPKLTITELKRLIKN